jgi:hypothetical protein
MQLRHEDVKMVEAGPGWRRMPIDFKSRRRRQETGRPIMRKALGTMALLAALSATGASAQVQGVDLNGRYRCVALCVGGPGGFAFITQYGWQLNVVNEAGQASRAWVEYPGRIWVDQETQGAIYSPDGLTVQFDHGRIWQRALELPPPRIRK